MPEALPHDLALSAAVADWPAQLLPENLPPGRRIAALALLRQMRCLDRAVGIRHSGIARDIGLLLYEHAGRSLTIKEISRKTGYTGPSVRLVLGRLVEVGVVAAMSQDSKVQIYRLTPKGLEGFDAYPRLLSAFVDAVAGRGLSAAAAPEPDRDPGADPQLPPGRYAGAQPARAAAD